jgi:hypothetical protein
VHCEPQKLSVIEPLKRGPPILDLFGLLRVEHEGCEHLPCFQRPLRFPVAEQVPHRVAQAEQGLLRPASEENGHGTAPWPSLSTEACRSAIR